MKRSMLAALAASAVIGTTGGTTAAVQLLDGPGRDADPVGATRSDATDGNADPDDEGEQQLLWASGSAIHDGDTVVDIEIPRADAVYRAAGGYLVLTYDEDDEPYERPGGTAQLVAPDSSGLATIEFRGVGDVSDDGTEFIAMNRRATAYEIWDLTAATVTETPSRSITSGLTTDSTRPYGGAALAGDQILTTWYDGAYPQVVSMRPENDERSEVAYNAYDWAVSSDGTRFTATTTDEGPNDGQCLTVGDTLSKAGRAVSCEMIPSYAGPKFSPSGDTMVALDLDSVVGDQPGFPAYEIVSSEPTDGAPEVLATITPPEGATSAMLEDDEHLLVVAPSGTGGLSIFRCDLESRCAAVDERTDAESIVFGSQ